MAAIKECLKQIKRRPIIFIYTAIMMLVLCVIEEYNPVTKEYGSFKVLFKQSYVDTLSMFAQRIKDLAQTPGIMALNIIVAILIVLAFSAIMGIFGAGHGHVMYLSFVSEKKRKGEFRQGINKHYVKVMFYIFFSMLLSALFTVAIAYVMIPAIMSVKIVLAGDSGSIFVMLAISVLTVGVVYMSSVFFVMTLSVIFPAMIAYKKGGITVAFRMVRGYCWYLIPRVTLFMFVMLLSEAGLLAIGFGLASVATTVIALIANWIIKTLAVFIYMYFIFGAFMGMKEDMFPSYSE